MRVRCLTTMFTVIAVTLLAPPGVVGQTLTAAADNWTSSRTSWGDPDLEGTWTNETTTTLERSDDLAGQEFLTDEERTTRDQERIRNSDQKPPPGQTGSFNSFWFERGTLSMRTSLVVDPSDGKLPPLTPKEHTRRLNLAKAKTLRPADAPEDLGAYDRCISRGLPGSMMPGFYNHNYQILQTPEYVVILVEMIHDARIVPLDARPHVDHRIRQWLGDSRGWWDGDTLVVETTNLNNKAKNRSLTTFGSSEHTRLVERFTRVGKNTIDYQITVSDPTEYARPWTASIPMAKLEGQLYEYACHEGNYAIRNILTGARAQERAVPAAP